MPEKNFSIIADGPKRIKLKWSGSWKKMAVSCDDQPLGIIENKKALLKGADFVLPEGENLHVFLKGGFQYQPDLSVLINGKPAPGSNTDPLILLKSAIRLTYFIAGINIALGGAGLIGVSVIADMELGVYPIIFGACIGALGFWVQKSQSKIALILAMTMFALDGLITVVASLSVGESPNFVPLIIKVLFLLAMFKGVKAIDQLKQDKS